MNKIIKSLLVTALGLSASHIQAHTNKTFLNHRSHGVNIALENGGGFTELAHRYDKNKFGATLQGVGFYSDTTNEDDTARYFLVGDCNSHCKNGVQLKFGQNNVPGVLVQTEANGAGLPAGAFFAPFLALPQADALERSTENLGIDQQDVINAIIGGNGIVKAIPNALLSGQTTNILNAINGILGGDNAFRPHANAATTPLDLNFKLDPEQQAYGVYLNYHQDLYKLLNGLYFSVNVPVVHVENELNPSFDCSNNDVAKLVRDFLRGEKIVDTNIEKLERARIKGGDDSHTSIADIDLILGYKFFDKEKYRAAINVGFTIPTGNEADSHRVFEAIVGNHQHFAFGAGLDAEARVWGDMKHNLKVHAAFNFRYLFEASERRTLGLKDVHAGQYSLLIDGQRIGSTSEVRPAANVTTLNVDVTPGSQFDGIINLAYNNGGWHVDAGYNIYFREDEEVKLKSNCGLDEERFFSLALLKILKNCDLSTASAETPSQTTHKLYGHLGYVFHQWDTPVSIAAGAHYEWASNNSALEGWGVNGRVGISF